MNIYSYVYFDIARDVVTFMLMFVNVYHFNHTFSRAYIGAHTHKHTCMIRTHEEGREPGIEAWLGGAKEGFSCVVKDKDLAHTHTHKINEKR